MSWVTEAQKKRVIICICYRQNPINCKETVYLLPMGRRILGSSWQNKCVIGIGTLLSLSSVTNMTIGTCIQGRGWVTTLRREYFRPIKLHIKPEAKPMKWCWEVKKLCSMSAIIEKTKLPVSLMIERATSKFYLASLT